MLVWLLVDLWLSSALIRKEEKIGGNVEKQDKLQPVTIMKAGNQSFFKKKLTLHEPEPNSLLLGLFLKLKV